MMSTLGVTIAPWIVIRTAVGLGEPDVLVTSVSQKYSKYLS